MRTPPLRIMLAVVVLAGLVAAPSAAAKTKTTVTIQGVGQSHGGTPYFQGQVTSSKVSCKEDRKVTLYRVQPGKDKRLGADRTHKVTLGRDQDPAERWQGLAARYRAPFPKYFWEVEVRNLKVGKYYGVAKETDSCRGDKSKTFKLDETF